MDDVLVEATRGAHVESCHRGAAVVLDADGGVLFAAGDIDAPVYPRSAVKALLALPLVESGAADRLGLTDAEIALACASHSGEPEHAATAAAMLGKVGRQRFRGGHRHGGGEGGDPEDQRLDQPCRVAEGGG